MSIDKLPQTSFEKTSLGWYISQLQQHAGEWIELRFFQGIKKIEESGLALPEWLFDVLVWLAWIIFALTAAWLGLILFRLARSYFYRFSAKIRPVLINSSSDEIPQTLPVSQWLKLARAYQLQGNYAEACRALYMGMLQLFSDRDLIPQQPSRTDGEYAQLLKNLPYFHLSQTILRAHEQLCFSSNSISSEIFGNCEQAYTDISDQIEIGSKSPYAE